MSTTSAAAAASATGEGTSRAPSQGGILDGTNPTVYNPKDPIILFIIQASFIIIICHLLHWPLSKIRQPRVIAEVIGGIVLGPSVMGRIPGFHDAIFPDESLPNLNLVANLGLILYLFMIGLETDVGFLLSYWKTATAVAFGGLALPFGLGCALAWGLYHQFSDDPGVLDIQFSTYMLFIGVAIAITAFPVLCRILTALNLLGTTAGVVTLAAGVANDVIGWILLALCVALANADNGILSLYIMLVALGFCLFLFLAVKPAMFWLLRFKGDIERGPSQSMISLILLVALAAAFFTGVIGIHPIFGGFLVGLIVPRQNSFAIKVTEKLEDLIGALFLPLYFTLSGLNTNLGLLDSGIVWGYVIAITVVALLSKIIGASIAARLTGLVWREALTVGTLMSCKGLVELVVLNIGLSAKILSQRVFTMFVVMALLTTFFTTPVTMWLYPPWYQKKIAAWKRGEIDWETGETRLPSDTSHSPEPGAAAKTAPRRVGQMLVFLRLDNLPSMLSLVSLFGKAKNPTPSTSASTDGSGAASSEKQINDRTKVVKAHGLRLMHLGDRDSSVMTVSEVETYTRNDPVVNTFCTVGQFMRVAVSGEVAVVIEERFGDALMAKATDISSDLVLLPWVEKSAIAEVDVAPSYTSVIKSVLGSRQQTVAILAPQRGQASDTTTSVQKRGELVRTYSFNDIHRDVKPMPVVDKWHNIIMPYVGGEDDKAALSLLIQICESQSALATVIHITVEGSSDDESDYLGHVATSLAEPIKSRIDFKTASASDIASEAVKQSTTAIRADTSEASWNNVIVTGRRRAAHVSHTSDERESCLGHTATTIMAAQVKADVLVVQAKDTSKSLYR